MSEFTTIRQPAGQRTLALREAYLAICEGDACEAHLLNAQERWYAYKLKNREQARAKNKASRIGGDPEDENEALWVRMNAEGWAEDLLGIYNEKTVRNKLASLVKRGFLSTRNNPRQAWDRTPQWLFERVSVQAAVDLWDASREAPDLDPSEADAVQEQSDPLPDSTRTIVRVDAEDLPDRVGQSPELNRTKLRSNNTGVLTQESLHSSPKQVVSEPAERPTGTTTSERQEEHAGEAAALRAFGVAPDGAGPDGPFEGQVDPEQDQLQALQGSGTPPNSEKVPPAAPDPEAVRALLTPKLGGKNRLDGFLQEAPPSGVKRARWLQLPATQVEALIASTDAQVAQAKAEGKKPNAWTLLLRALDEAIGAQVPQGSSRPAMATSAPASQTAATPGALTTGEHNSRLDVGARYRRKSDGAVLAIEGTERVKNGTTEGERFRLGGASVTALELMTKFEFVGAPEAVAS